MATLMEDIRHASKRSTMKRKPDSKRKLILKSVCENEIVRLTRKLVSLQSVNPPGNEKGCAEYIAELLRDIGLKVELVEREKNRPNVIGTLRGSVGSPRLLYNGHMDVVPPGQGWTVDPFSGKVIDGKIYGRGTSDMKSGLSAMISSAKALVEADARLRGDLVVAAVPDEEMLGQNGTAHLVHSGLKADMAVIGEPTCHRDDTKRMRVEIAHRGVVWMRVGAEGKAAHGGTPWLGTNAIYAMSDAINAIRLLEKQLARKKHPLVSSPTINVGTITGGMAINIVPNRCYMTLDRRVIPTETVEEAKSELVSVVEGLRKRDERYKLTCELLNERGPFEISPDEPVVVTIRKAAQQVTGTPPSLGGKDSCTDADCLVKSGIPTALFGPGIDETSHTADEYAEIDRIVEATKVYALTAFDLLK